MTAKITFTPKELIHIFIMLVFMFLFRFVPGPGTVTEYGMAVLGIFIGLVWGWTFIGLLWPSVLGFIALTVVGTSSFEVLITGAFNNTVIMLIIGSIVFSILGASGIADYFIAKLLSSKMVAKSPYTLCWVLFALSWFLAGFCGGSIVSLLCLLPIIDNLLTSCGYEKGDKFNVFFIAGIILIAQFACSLFPFKGWGLMTSGTIAAGTGIMVDYGVWMVAVILMSIVFLVVYPFFMKIFGCDFSKIRVTQGIDGDASATEKTLTLNQKLILGVVAAFVITVVSMSLLGSKVAFLGLIQKKIGVTGLLAIMWVVLMLVKVNDVPLLDMRKAAATLSWDLIILIAVALLISNQLTSAETGISAFVSSLVVPMFAGKSQVVFLIVLALLTLILTNFANNIAICFIMLNIVTSMYINGFEVNLLAATLIITVTSTIAILTPASSAQGAMIHSAESLTPGVIYKWAPIICLFAIAVLLVTVVPLGILFT